MTREPIHIDPESYPEASEDFKKALRQAPEEVQAQAIAFAETDGSDLDSFPAYRDWATHFYAMFAFTETLHDMALAGELDLRPKQDENGEWSDLEIVPKGKPF